MENILDDSDYQRVVNFVKERALTQYRQNDAIWIATIPGVTWNLEAYARSQQEVIETLIRFAWKSDECRNNILAVSVG